MFSQSLHSSADVSPREFLKAAREGNVAIVSNYIDQNRGLSGALDIRDRDGRSAACIAMDNDHINITQALLAAGAAPGFGEGEEVDGLKLLGLIRQADYMGVEQLLAHNPLLIFQPITTINAADRREETSPLKLAVKLLDTYMWQMFENIIKAKMPELMQEFETQLLDQYHAGCIDLTLLYYDYDNFILMLNDWPQRVSNQQILDAWHELGAAQQVHLPKAMLLEFCRRGTAWTRSSTFDVTALARPDTCETKVYYYGKFTELSFQELKKLLGSGGTLIRGEGDSDHACVGHIIPDMASLHSSPACGNYGVIKDEEIIRHLHEVRRNDLAVRIAKIHNVREEESCQKRLRFGS